MKKTQTPILPKLSYFERTVVAPMIRKMLQSTPDYYFKNYEIILHLENNGVKTHSPTVRKIINYLRCLTIPIVSTNKGYAYSSNEEFIIDTIIQLQTRIEAMLQAKQGLLYNLRLINLKRNDSSVTMEDILDELNFM